MTKENARDHLFRAQGKLLFILREMLEAEVALRLEESTDSEALDRAEVALKLKTDNMIDFVVESFMEKNGVEKT